MRTLDGRLSSNRRPFNVANHTVGIESRVDDVTNLLCSGDDHTSIIGIQGVGGIGKTTIAKAVCNELSNQFEATSFLSDISEKSKQPNGLASLRGQLISEISETGLEKDAPTMKRALVILDDVDRVDQIDELLDRQHLFAAGSKIIVTTRCEDVLIMKGIENHKIYKPNELDEDESLRLFSYHAFLSERPLEGFVELSEQVVQLTGGLPLELEIFGSLFYNIRTEDEWEEMLVRLMSAQDQDVQGIQHGGIQERLRIAYEELDSNEKRIFLDIACFFIGRGKEYAMHMWEACGLHPSSAIEVLLRKSLVQIDSEKDEFVMHDRIRDMGREIVISEGVMRSRFWNEDGITEALQNNEETGERIEGISLNLEEGGQIDLGTEAFERLHQLRLLRVNFANFENNDFCHFPEDLKWLEWRGCPSESLPLDCRFKKLSILILSQSNITQLWNESAPSGTQLNIKLEDGVFHGLKVLDLSSCAHLNSSPGFASVPHLQKLILDDCTSLTELDESLGCLEKLKFLSMRMCENLIRLPDNMHQLLSLENLILGNCSKLSAIPKLPSTLITLEAKDCTDLKMPLDFSNLTNLKSLNLQGCKKIVYCSGLEGLESIEVLLMDGCEGLSFNFMESFQGIRFNHLKEFSITGSWSCFETLGEVMVFMFPYGSENDPLLMDYVHCHGHVIDYESHRVHCHGHVIDYESHRNIMVLIRHYAGDEVMFEAVKEACRDDDNDLEDHNRGYCYTLNLNGNDEVTRQLTAFYNKIYISTADGSLLRRIDMKLRHNNYWAGVNNDLRL
ncbi:disease resistance protein Roq1-like [Nymphaea colorata]|nr:disease resistance protein Roq1-like [Nymphaea colorata]